MSANNWTMGRGAAVLLTMLAVVIFGLADRASALTHLYPNVSEVDGDGIDNDGDGYIDSADTECGSHYQGYGCHSVGGQGGQVYWVDCNLGDPSTDTHAGTFADPCSLRKALQASNHRVVKFVNGGTITLQSSGINIQNGYVTIDGFSAPSPGVTITHTASHGAISIAPNRVLASNIIINNLRFDGLFETNPVDVVGWGLLGIDGDCNGNSVSDVVFDHLSLRDLQDKFAIWGKVTNVTVSNCILYDSYLACLNSFYGAPYDLERLGMSYHHNVFADNNERNPQVRGWVRELDLVNNVIYGWDYAMDSVGDGYGIRLKDEPGEQKIDANIVNNYFYNTRTVPQRALIYGWDPGRDSYDNGPTAVLPQGSVYTSGSMGQLWVLGNVLPTQNMDQYSTIYAPLAVQSWAQIPAQPATQLYKTVCTVGTQFKDSREQTEINSVLSAITPNSVLNVAMFYDNSAFDATDDANAIAPDKQPLLPGQTAGFANYTSFAGGINGLMIDLPNATGVTASSFTFQTGNSNNLAGWQTAPAPASVTVLADQGVAGSDRVKLTWADGAIKNTWLRVTVKASTGISSDYVFYVGNCVGESGNADPRVSPADAVAVRNHGTAAGGAAVANQYDFDRDAKVGPADEIAARNNGNTAATTLQMITAP